MRFSSLAIRSLRHRTVRTVSTVLTTAVAIAALTLTLAVLERLRGIHAITQGQDLLIVESTEDDGVLPFSYIEQIRHIPDAEPVVWVRAVHASDGDRYSYAMLGFSDAYPETVPPAWTHLTPEVAKRWRADRRAIVVGTRTAAVFGWKPGDTVAVKTAEFGDVTGNVAGLADGYANTNVIAHYEYLDELATEKGSLMLIWVRAPHDRLSAVSNAIDERFANSPQPTQSMPMAAHAQSLLDTVTAVPELLWRIGLLMVLVMAGVTMAAVSVSLRERYAELATLRCIGFTRMKVLRLVLLESMLASFLGGLLGAVLPAVLFHKHGLPLGAYIMNDVPISAYAAAGGLAASIVFGAVIALPPGIVALRRAGARLLVE
jgi:putative ABC transport system permease protein